MKAIELLKEAKNVLAPTGYEGCLAAFYQVKGIISQALAELQSEQKCKTCGEHHDMVELERCYHNWHEKKWEKMADHIRDKQAELEHLKKQLKEGHHCQSFDMCGATHDRYQAEVADEKVLSEQRASDVQHYMERARNLKDSGLELKSALAAKDEALKYKISLWQVKVNELKFTLAAKDKRIVRYEKALDKLARLGNEPMLGNSVGNVIARQALTKGK